MESDSGNTRASTSFSGTQLKSPADPAPAEAEWSEPPSAADRQCSGSCRRLPPPCLSCRFNSSCVYGANVTVRCRPAEGVSCTGRNDSFDRTMVCAYCYQTPVWQHSCSMCDASVVHKTPGRKFYRANCTVDENVLCMGNRTFYKRLVCKWTKGDRWSTALTLSIILGGFGVDRFYLGHWQEAIGKFFSFGGLGVWTLIDVVLIAIGYLSPADGSLYIT
ncbi:TM2 domain-containing protein almondex-like isoform X1 [Amphibalanus amphitrite]|nr:TM2 domain-containing protein almondex-like isoform X1 [Amphibalanus amphitrite]XP_043240695.1 TM2 domain-containing protein almondex-like isoform X1 [Amphibalanus amphitrite]XP_043240697.1 TM2 domain-containing protein almondex-like isoform X1 [Amphibalanus amphitrite]XP_043240698.1 TM2 domain-containing protein almondex-like isoform X1 [Amphibalanus amphitrite]XP_043240699.1 TM2 domain-containing protein almondex-like isoform X1 [Amphibalanus amphitrite]